MKDINSAFKISTLIMFMLTALCTVGSAENYVLVMNKDKAAEMFSKDKVKTIFIGDKIKWDDNSTIVLTVLNDGNDIHEAFIKNYVGRSSVQYAATWKKNIFTGKGTPPKMFNDSSSMFDYISKNKNAVGYATKNTKLPDQLKAVDIN